MIDVESSEDETGELTGLYRSDEPEKDCR